MIRSVRAAGFAVAACVLAVSAAWSGPLQAGEGDVAPMASHYLDHAGASAEVSDFGVNDETVTVEASPTAAPEQLAHAGALAEHMISLADAVLTQPSSLGAMVYSYAGIATANSEQECLANAVYFEARSEPIEGQLAVAEVVLNRAASGRYPTDLCAVITQKAQFSFIQRGRFPRADRSSEAWKKAVAIANIARQKLAGSLPSSVLWYHATYVSPSWGKRLTKQTQIGLHIFYS
jgi:hypothetical protein